MIKAQLYDGLTKKLGKLTENKDTAKYLDENVFQYGGSKTDDEILEKVTGKKLNADAFCKRLNKLVQE